MKNIFEKFLISVLLATSVLLGLSFWLNVKFHFNLFSLAHWNTLAQLQASHTPVDKAFYISVGVAIFIFLFGFVIIITHRHNSNVKTIPQQKNAEIQPIQQTAQQTASPQQQPSVLMTRPPRLNLPKNMAQVVAAKHNENSTQQQQTQPQTATNNGISPYNPLLAEIFSDAGYIVKKLPSISGFTPNLFAIGGNEILWFGGVDTDVQTIKSTINKLQETFRETLEDIPINIFSFIIDTTNKYSHENDADNETEIFHSVDECRQFIMEHSAPEIPEDEKENFQAYSEYIDTVIQYVKNL